MQIQSLFNIFSNLLYEQHPHVPRSQDGNHSAAWSIAPSQLQFAVSSFGFLHPCAGRPHGFDLFVPEHPRRIPSTVVCTFVFPRSRHCSSQLLLSLFSVARLPPQQHATSVLQNVSATSCTHALDKTSTVMCMMLASARAVSDATLLWTSLVHGSSPRLLQLWQCYFTCTVASHLLCVPTPDIALSASLLRIALHDDIAQPRMPSGDNVNLQAARGMQSVLSVIVRTPLFERRVRRSRRLMSLSCLANCPVWRTRMMQNLLMRQFQPHATNWNVQNPGNASSKSLKFSHLAKTFSLTKFCITTERNSTAKRCLPSRP